MAELTAPREAVACDARGRRMCSQATSSAARTTITTPSIIWARARRPNRDQNRRTTPCADTIAAPKFPSAQRTAVKQRPHQETRKRQMATSEPAVLHHGREGAGAGGDEA